MLNTPVQPQLRQAFASDSYAWFKELRHGHMEKWQYGEPQFRGDPVRGAKLWDIWEKVANQNPQNMLARQGEIIKERIGEMIALTKPRNTLLDLGPGGIAAVQRNTVPFIEGYGDDLSRYIAIDIANEAADGARDFIEANSDLDAKSLNDDFLKVGLQIPYNGQCVALFMGGTIGNFEAEPNTPDTVKLMASQIIKLKKVLPPGTVVFIGLELPKHEDLLYADYDPIEHREFEINIMHGIKRDVLSDEDGFDPYAWKYSMQWYPDAHQFCHFAEATREQKFSMFGEKIEISQGKRLLIDNSFKFPVLSMQRASQIAGAEYLQPFVDADNRMAIHALRL